MNGIDNNIGQDCFKGKNLGIIFLNLKIYRKHIKDKQNIFELKFKNFKNKLKKNKNYWKSLKTMSEKNCLI